MTLALCSTAGECPSLAALIFCPNTPSLCAWWCMSPPHLPAYFCCPDDFLALCSTESESPTPTVPTLLWRGYERQGPIKYRRQQRRVHDRLSTFIYKSTKTTILTGGNPASIEIPKTMKALTKVWEFSRLGTSRFTSPSALLRKTPQMRSKVLLPNSVLNSFLVLSYVRTSPNAWLAR
jgi:hypothetical protein